MIDGFRLKNGVIRMKRLLKRWWEGNYVPPRNDPNGSVFILQGNYEKH
jgi:hypothetical protein